jgi:hypothetical protein
MNDYLDMDKDSNVNEWQLKHRQYIAESMNDNLNNDSTWQGQWITT